MSPVRPVPPRMSYASANPFAVLAPMEDEVGDEQGLESEGAAGGPGAGEGRRDEGEEMQVEEGSEGSEDEERGERRVKKMIKAVSPTKEQREQHKCTGHAVYRNWCSDCVAGRGQSKRHYRGIPVQGELPLLSIDYGFLGPRCKLCKEDDPEILMTFLGLNCQLTGGLAGLAVREKGLAGGDTADRVCEKISKWGHGGIRFRSDGERAIVGVKQEVKEKRKGEQTILETCSSGPCG